MHFKRFFGIIRLIHLLQCYKEINHDLKSGMRYARDKL